MFYPLFIVHILIYCFIDWGSLLLPKNMLKLWLVSVFLMILQWYTYGDCVLSVLERDKNNDELSTTERFLHLISADRYKQYVFIAKDIWLYLMIINAFYRLNYTKYGLIILMSVVFINCLLYKKPTFFY